MNKEYKIKLDLNKKIYNKKMTFNQFDENVNDFYIEVTKNNEVVKNLDKSIITLVAIKPNGTVDAQFIEVKEGQIYVDLKPSMCDLAGNYQAKAMIVLEGEIVTTDTINYSVNEDKIISRLNDDIVSDERFTLFTDALARLSAIEISEEQRVKNEAERILSEENRKIEEAKRVEAELIRQHEEADRTKYDAIRESNENIRKQNESIRLANETNRIDEEAKRVEEEAKRKLAEEERNANYNFMTEDEERRRSEANAHKEAEVLRVQAETNRVNEEAKRRTTEQARVSAENTRVGNENVREANEVARQNNETKRVEAETQRQSRYNSFIADAEANANEFENYTNTAKVKEEERKSNELDRKSQETKRVSNEVERISNENTRKANEVVREENETSRQNVFENKVNEIDKKIVEMNTAKDNFVSSVNTKVDTKISELDTAKSDMTNTVTNKIDEVEGRFNALTASQQQSSEVIDARDGEVSLKARLDRDIEKAKQVYVNVEGSNISTDSSNGYAKDVEILGNTIQDASNLADIRSVGDTVEGQELYEIPVLSCGKNLFDGEIELGGYDWSNGVKYTATDRIRCKNQFIPIKPNTKYVSNQSIAYVWYDNAKQFIKSDMSYTTNPIQSPKNAYYVNIVAYTTDLTINIALYESDLPVSVYEPYQEDKLTILSPVQLEKVGDIADRIICKDGVWGVEKNIVEFKFSDATSCTTLGVNSNGLYGYSGRYNFGAHRQSISNKLPFNYNWNSSTPCFYIQDADFVALLNENLTINEFKLQYSDMIIKYITTQPQFIPLPHDQQVKLRTFANKTNISFLTEIEGTIKAQVPKSIGATVNTHTEQISNLNKELDRVKKLEESTVSTIETESDFTTVEATSNGYFEDVKLEGKTLVNLLKQNGTWFINADTTCHCKYKLVKSLEVGKTYTYFYFNLPNTITQAYLGDGGANIPFVYWGAIKKAHSFIATEERATLLEVVPHFRTNGTDTLTTSEIENIKLVLLEGDHTQNPPSYFEGLKSVGDTTDEIVVSSVNENLLDISMIKYLGGSSANTVPSIQITDSGFSAISNIEGHGVGYVIVVPLSGDYTLSYTNLTNATVHYWSNLKNNFIPNLNNLVAGDRISIDFKPKVSGSFGADNIQFSFGKKLEYTPHQSDKKRLLYYNEETQTWEKPILRQWDSIEKHADGKYYYHQRSAEVVLNGSESWAIFNTMNQNDTLAFHVTMNLGAISSSPNNTVCDKFSWKDVYVNASNEEGHNVHLNSIRFSILKSKLSTQDAQGFKQWLQANNVTVVYQLAEEKVYECTNIDLITYANETNYIVECGAIVPKTTLKVHSNISNVVSLLQKKVSLLESNVKASQEVQDMMILETDMRMLDIELALMEFIPMKLNLLGGSDMLRSTTYFNFLKNHIINETYEKEYLENVMNKYLATGRINQDEYDELYKILYPPVYDIELPIEY